MNNFLKLSFWFDVRPLPFESYLYWVILGICLLFLAIGLISSYLRWKNLKNNVYARNAWLKIGHWCYSFSISGLLLFFFRQEMVMYLGMRSFFAVWILAHLAWLIFVVKYVVLELPKYRREAARKKEFQKYLP